MIVSKTIKYTKNNQVMAFITVEDLVGSVEVLVFPKVYEQYRPLLEEDNKVFVEGRVSAEDDKASKLICERMTPFSEVTRELWIAFPDLKTYQAKETELQELLGESDGRDAVLIYLRDTKRFRRLPGGITVTPEAKEACAALFGADSVTVRVSARR